MLPERLLGLRFAAEGRIQLSCMLNTVPSTISNLIMLKGTIEHVLGGNWLKMKERLHEPPPPPPFLFRFSSIDQIAERFISP